MCEKLEVSLREEIFFKAGNYFSKIFIIIKGVKMKLRRITKNMQSIQLYSLLENRFYGLWTSQRPPASVRVKFEMIVKLYLIRYLTSKKTICESLCSKNGEIIKLSF